MVIELHVSMTLFASCDFIPDICGSVIVPLSIEWVLQKKKIMGVDEVDRFWAVVTPEASNGCLVMFECIDSVETFSISQRKSTESKNGME